MTKLHIDFETASTADLKKIGAAAYARHPDTRVLCMAWAFDSEKPQVWLPNMGFPMRVARHVGEGDTVAGWNLQFEYHIWNHCLLGYMVPALDSGQLDDTQARAAYHGLPFSLEEAGAALRLPIQKDKVGHALMLRMSRPRATEPNRWWHVEDPAKYLELQAYCIRDVEVEHLIDTRLPPLPHREREVWLQDFVANDLGIAVDKALIKKLDRLARDSRKTFDQRMNLATAGEVPSVSNVKKLYDYVNRHGASLPDIHKDTIKAYLDRPGMMTPPVIIEALELRRAAAKTSAAKLPVLLAASPGGVARGLLAYYGAQRTGRWAGRLVQPQNLPRGVLKEREIGQALGAVAAGATPEDLELLFGRPGVSSLDIVTALIRGCFVARNGKRLVVADFSQIEARVIAWLAGQKDILKVFEAGEDVYTHTANAIGSQSRQLGKVLVLACGFGQGPAKFQQTAKSYGLDLTPGQCEDAVNGWRKANSKIVALWYAYERAAKMVANSADMVVTTLMAAGKVVFKRRKAMMVIVLPSGRELFYHNIRLVNGDLTYSGVEQTSKRWLDIKTYGGKLAENVTQAVARDVMCEAILALPDGLDLLLTVHDELVCEGEKALAPLALARLLSTMKQTPGWAAGLPVGAAGWTGHRYKKG